MFKRYKPQNILGWSIAAIGIGLLSLLKADSSKAASVGYQVLGGLGLGLLYAGPTFAILAPLPVTRAAHALALSAFIRSYAQTWGVTVGATIMQNELQKKLPAALLAMFPSSGVEIAYAIIPQISRLAEPLQTEVREAFASSLRVIWYVMAAMCVVGAISALGMKEIKMHEVTDEDWGMEEEKREDAAEKV